MIKNRFLSFVLIFIVYILAVSGGIISYNILEKNTMLSYQIILLISDVFATVIVFLFSLILKNASVYDPYWSVQPPVILCTALIKCGKLGLYF